MTRITITEFDGIDPDLANLLPADLAHTIMQYACYKTHPTAKMIKQAVEDDYELKSISDIPYPIFRAGKRCGWWWDFGHSDYIERDCAEMFREIEAMTEDNPEPCNWFHTLTEQYADISEEWYENLRDYRLMIIEAQQLAEGDDSDDDDDVDYRIAQGRAYGLYKIISNCPTWVH